MHTRSGLLLSIVMVLVGLALGAGLAEAQGPPPPPVIFHSPVLSWVGSGNFAAGGVYPTLVTAGTSFTFEVKYSHQDNLAPQWVRLYIKNPAGALIAGSPFTMQGSGATSWMTGVVFTAHVTLSARGQYAYRFQTYDGAYNGYLPATGTVPGPAVDGVPTLSLAGTTGYTTGGVAPTTGPAGTSFRFEIKYTDAQGIKPTSLVAHVWGPNGQEISGSPFSLSALVVSPSYTAGAIFWKGVTLTTVGKYSYSFAASDGIRTVPYPATGKLTGPTVTAKTAAAASVLSYAGTAGYATGGVAPTVAREGNFFRFEIKYTNADGVAPSSVMVHVWGPNGKEIDGSPFAMVPSGSSPDYAQGAVFWREVHLTLVGAYSYSFAASAGGVTVTDPATGKLTGPTATG